MAQRRGWRALALAGTAALLCGELSARASPAVDARGEVRADAPSAISVTVYRDPSRSAGSIDLDRLAGFALVTESRTVHVPAGDSRLRFEGVADGIEPQSAIITGLDQDIVERNRDAAVLSPSALIAAAVGGPVTLVRTDRRTGTVQRVAGRVLSDAGGGVVFESDRGIEALRCSGMPETLLFEGTEHLSARPTLSVKVRSRRAFSAVAKLSYLARGFDWGADYSATLAPDGRSMDLGAWVTLANGNGTGFPRARTQVVAGRLNRDSGQIEPIDIGGPLLANCWPRGSTSDVSVSLQLQRGRPVAHAMAMLAGVRMAAAAPLAAPLLAQAVLEESLGDLKLYRVPEPTTLAARQSKQVRLLDRGGIPVRSVYVVELDGAATQVRVAASRVLRTTNDSAHHLALPLPAGRVQVFAIYRGARLLERETTLRDVAVNEEVELDLGPSAEVSVAARRDAGSHRVDVSNAGAGPIQVEIAVRLADGARIRGSDRKLESKNGRPIFRFEVPAQSTAKLEYHTSVDR